jgi:hypothetical protein
MNKRKERGLAMIGKNVNTKGLFLSQATVLVAAILLLCFRQAPADNAVSVAKNPNARTAVMARKDSAFEKILSCVPVGNFQTSLEMKENVDFLLTPALLVQEIISDDVLITYPSE